MKKYVAQVKEGEKDIELPEGFVSAKELAKKIEKDVKNRQKGEKEDITQILTSLNEGKYDFKIFDAPTVNAIIKNNKLSNLKTIELKSDQQPYIYFLFADNQKDLQKFVNKRLEELQKDGTLAKLAEKFLGNKDYIPTKDALKVPSKK